MRAALSAVCADIGTLPIEAIVNAANEPLILGGGVDGVIRRKAGPGMEAELRAIGHCPTGQAVLTHGHALAAKFVIHTVAPVWRGSDRDAALLADCYKSTLTLARAHGIAGIAFPCLGTGAFGWPPELAAQTAFQTVRRELEEDNGLEHVVFCCFSEADKRRYDALIAAVR